MIRRILGGGLAAALGFLTLSPAAAQAQVAHASPPAHVVNLHAAYERALGQHVRAGRISGIVYPIGHRPATAGTRAAAGASGGSSCAEPDCRITYHGGTVEHTAHIYLLLWGPTWNTNSGEEATATYLENFYKALGVQPQDHWSTITSQYTDTTGGFPTFSGSQFAGVYHDTSAPPSGTTQNQFSAEAQAFAAAHNLTSNPQDDQIVIVTQSGTCPSGFYSPSVCGTPSSSSGYCAYHSNVVSGTGANGVTFTNLPYLLDAGSSCGENIVSNGARSMYDGFSIVGGHEYAETITDPYPDPGSYAWIDLNDPFGGEVGDKCAWYNAATGAPDIGLVTLSNGAFAMQPLFSNANYAAHGQVCPLSATPDTLRVKNPGTQTSAAGIWVRLHIHAHSSTQGAHYQFAATGLPAGLRINARDGWITGTPRTVATSHVTVTVTDTTNSTTSRSFTWTVKVGKRIRGNHDMCVTDYHNSRSNGARVVVWHCNHTTKEVWVRGPRRSLVIYGKCLTDPHNHGKGSGLVLDNCTGHANQSWRHRRNGEWVVRVHGRNYCLTDPSHSTRNGTRLRLEKCHPTSNRRWRWIRA